MKALFYCLKNPSPLHLCRFLGKSELQAFLHRPEARLGSQEGEVPALPSAGRGGAPHSLQSSVGHLNLHWWWRDTSVPWVVKRHIVPWPGKQESCLVPVQACKPQRMTAKVAQRISPLLAASSWISLHFGLCLTSPANVQLTFQHRPPTNVSIYIPVIILSSPWLN